MISLSCLKPVCFAVVAACAVACTSGHNAASPGTTHGSTATTPATQSPAPAQAATAQQAAEGIKAAVPDVNSLIALTENNDTNNLIGRVNGYAAATVLVDSRIEGCETAKPGVDCGATVEQWPDQPAAQRRADYIKSVLSSAPALGSEYDTVKGNLLLRVSGKLKPSAAQAYQAAFTG